MYIHSLQFPWVSKHELVDGVGYSNKKLNSLVSPPIMPYCVWITLLCMSHPIVHELPYCAWDSYPIVKGMVENQGIITTLKYFINKCQMSSTYAKHWMVTNVLCHLLIHSLDSSFDSRFSCINICYLLVVRQLYFKPMNSNLEFVLPSKWLEEVCSQILPSNYIAYI